MKILTILALWLTPFIVWGQTCVLASSQEIVYRSSGQSLDSSLYWGEDVTLCFTVSTYTPVGNGCQWFQGVVPQFGDGWDLTEFDGSIDATMNDSNYPTPGVYGGT